MTLTEISEKMTPMMECVAEVTLRYKRRIRDWQRVPLQCQYDVADLVSGMPFMRDNMDFRESMYAVYVDLDNVPLGVMKLAEGGINFVDVDVRLALQAALLLSATGVFLVHNHPSGKVTPSQKDLDVTQKVKSAADLLDIRLIDHLIIARDNAVFSFDAENML